MMNNRWVAAVLVLCVPTIALAASDARADFSMRQILQYPYATQLASAASADVIAWVNDVAGVRNVWVASGPAYRPVQVTRYTEDDGQEITQLTFTPDGAHLVYVLGGDHDANWPAEGNLAPDPASSTEQPVTAIWSASLDGSAPPQKIAEGDAPALSRTGQLAYIKEDHVWSTPLGGGKSEKLFFDRGKDGELSWSPDGSRLAFVSNRGDHAFIGVFTTKQAPLMYLSPSTGIDGSPRWSPDGTHIAFVRQQGAGGAPQPILTQSAHPWSIWSASLGDATAHRLWQSPDTLAGSYPDVAGEANLLWMAHNRIVFMTYLDEWPHLYSMDAAGGAPVLLTPGAFMVEHVAASRDLQTVIYDANTGGAAGDDERRHVFRVAVEHAGSTPLTAGDSLEWTPVSAGPDRVAYVSAGAQRPPAIGLVTFDGSHRMALKSGKVSAEFPLARLVTPKSVTFQAADGTQAHGQLFETSGSKRGTKPGIIFVHGGPPRQMLLGWHYMDYYSNAYAVNQYLAAHGFVVLSVNYRLGIGYGRAFHQPAHAGHAGASEYQDVVAGAHFLQAHAGVDGSRIGIWGGSYGGYLTALALARNSDIFKAGVDLHGVHDWSLLLSDWVGKPSLRFEKGDRDKALEVAFNASPDAAVEGWKSPVLLIQGDDDRNVPFQHTVDLARRLEAQHVPYEELILPNEIHGFLRYASWLRADEATAEFFARILAAH